MSRRYLAELAEFLLASGARVVGFDVQVRRASSPEEDGALVAVSRRWQGDSGRLVFTTVATPTSEGAAIRYTTAPTFSPELRALVGFANAPLGGDGLVRTLLPVLPAAGGGQLPSFALAVLAGYASYSGESLARTLADAGGAGPVLPMGDPRKGVTGQEPVALKTLCEANWRIDYVGRPGAFAAFPSGALVQLARGGVRPDADNPFRDKIVLVGATFAESGDFYGTPMGLMSGVEIQANMVHTLLSRRALLPAPWALNLTLLAGGCLWISLLSTRLGQLWVTGLSLALIAAMAALSYEAYSRGYWLDFIAPVAAMKLYRQGSNHLARTMPSTPGTR